MWADFYLAFNISACIIDGFKGGTIKYKERPCGSRAVNRVWNKGQNNTEHILHLTLTRRTLHLCIWQKFSSEETYDAFKPFIFQVCASNAWPNVTLCQQPERQQTRHYYNPQDRGILASSCNWNQQEWWFMRCPIWQTTDWLKKAIKWTAEYEVPP